MSNKPLSIAIACYPTYGGSGVIATEAGLELARRGHQVHFLSYDVPRRLNRFSENVFFHQVEAPSYPLFTEPHYVLALASTISQVVTQHNIDIVHAHYALPHAVSAFLARESLGKNAFKIVVTLHGTDITLVGNEPGYLPMTRFSITLGDAVTAVSEYLKQATYEEIGVPPNFPIQVIPNFVDLEVFRACEKKYDHIRSAICRSFRDGKKLIITHVSNFRAVKQVPLIVEAFALIRDLIPCGLLLVGDGPERQHVEQMVRERNLDCSVCFLGKQDSVEEILSASDLFVLASSTESFGLSALEAMASGIPVVAPRVGGLPEVVEDGKSGLLVEPNSAKALAIGMQSILMNGEMRKQMGDLGRRIAEEKFNVRSVVNQYEQLYYQLRGLN